MKTFVIILIFLVCGNEASLYGDTPYVDELHPNDLYELVRDQTEGLWMVQFYHTNDPTSEDYVSNYSIAAKSMSGYVRSAAINIEKHPLIQLVMKITQTPTYVFYGYYKHMPESKITLLVVDDLHEETSKQLVRVFEERSVYRFIHNKNNMEMGTADLDLNMMASKIPWLVVFYKRDHPRTPRIAKVWEELVSMFHERIQFGSVNNPLYNALSIDDGEYPLVKFYPKGNKEEKNAENITEDLSLEHLTKYLDDKIMSTRIRPQRIVDIHSVEPCLKKKFCIFVFLPNAVEYQGNSLAVLSEECSKHGRRAWGWFWTYYYEQPDIESVFSVSKQSGVYGTVAVLNVHAAMYMKISLVEELNAKVLNDIVEAIKDDAGFTYHVTSKKIPEVKVINTDAKRDEL